MLQSRAVRRSGAPNQPQTQTLERAFPRSTPCRETERHEKQMVSCIGQNTALKTPHTGRVTGKAVTDKVIAPSSFRGRSVSARSLVACVSAGFSRSGFNDPHSVSPRTQQE